MRPTDPIAERLLGLVLRLESAPWPQAQRTYARGLRALASRCDAPAAKAEIYRWLVREAGGALAVEDAAHRETLRDALHDAIARAPELLTRFHAGLDPERRPNLQSMLVRWIHWRADDLRCAERRYPGRWVAEVSGAVAGRAGALDHGRRSADGGQPASDLPGARYAAGGPRGGRGRGAEAGPRRVGEPPRAPGAERRRWGVIDPVRRAPDPSARLRPP